MPSDIDHSGMTLMVTDGNCTYCGEYFIMYTNVKSLCYTPETNLILCQLYFKWKKKRFIKNVRDSKDERKFSGALTLHPLSALSFLAYPFLSQN